MIRKAATPDIPALLALAEKLHSLHNPAPFDAGWKADWLRSFLEDGANLALLAIDREPIGYLLGEARTEDYTNSAFLYVREMLIEERFRGEGYGRRLLDDARRWAREGGHSHVMLSVRTGNPAAAFFRACGFLEFSTELKLPL